MLLSLAVVMHVAVYPKHAFSGKITNSNVLVSFFSMTDDDLLLKLKVGIDSFCGVKKIYSKVLVYQ